jgi:hypothetical protein
MKDTIRTMQDELDALLEAGFKLCTGHIQASDHAHTLSFLKQHTAYQAWYAKALRVITQLYPELSEAFHAQYRAIFPLPRGVSYPAWYTRVLPLMRPLTFQRAHDAADQEKAGEGGNRPASYGAAYDAGLGMAITENGEMIASAHLTFLAHFHQQLRILHSVRNGLEYVLADMQGALYSEVGEHVLAATYELFRHGHGRAAGTLAGVLLEIHLAKVAAKYRVPNGANAIGIAPLNEALKRGGIYDGEVWRFIQHLGALRHTCVDASRRDPTVDELTTLFQGVETIRKTVR